MYGKFDNFKDESSHVVPALIKKFLYAKENGLPEVRCFGSGEATRDLLNAADAAECLTKAIMTGFDYPSPINIGTGVETSIKSIAETINRLTGYDGQIVFTGEVSDGQPRRCLDTTKARDLLGWESSITLENGLFDTIDWYISS